MKIVSRQPSETGPARIGPLSVLPVFFDLANKRAVVAGGSDAAAWKAELLAAAGARVDLYAAELSNEMALLLERGTAIVHHPRLWDETCLAGAALALADAGDDEEAAAFERAARTAGVPCNVIDRPAYCHFQFGSIVNRAPVVVGISTSGAAPILGQAIRRRIETLLPPSLSDWALLARRWRDRVAEALRPGPPRRAFWERFVGRAFGPAPDAASVADLLAALGNRDAGGHVTFVTADPGDAELLTIKAVRALQSADVILFDDPFVDDVLELARREARRIRVGGHAGWAFSRQEEVTRLMIDLANDGRRVVRLKSSEPIFYAWAGIEIAAMERAGISCDVVTCVAGGSTPATPVRTPVAYQ